MRAIQVAILIQAIVLTACKMNPPQLDPDFEIAERLPGLVAIHHDDFDRAFLRPRAELGSFLALRIDSVQIEYYESPSHHTRTPPESTTRVLAETVREAFVDELSRDDGYPIVDEPGPGVLGVRLALVNIELNASSAMSSVGGAGGARVTTIGKFSVANEGPYEANMSIVVELYDTETDLLLFWGRDRRSSPLAMRGANRRSLLGRGRSLSQRWAEELREGLGGPPTRATRPEPAP